MVGAITNQHFISVACYNSSLFLAQCAWWAGTSPPLDVPGTQAPSSGGSAMPQDFGVFYWLLWTLLGYFTFIHIQ